MTRIVIEFDCDWILSHKDDAVLPADFLAATLKAEGLDAASDSFTASRKKYKNEYTRFLQTVTRTRICARSYSSRS